MAFSEQEKQLIAYAKANGKTQEETEKALTNFRLGVKPVSQNAVQTESPTLTAAKDVGIGFAKGAGSSIKGVGDLMLENLPDMIFGQGVGKATGISDALKSVSDKVQNKVGLTDENLKASNTAQKIGKGLEFAAEILTPFVAERFAGTAAKVPALLDSAGIKAGEKATGFFGKISEGLSTAKTAVQNALARKAVNPQLESSIDRLLVASEKTAKATETLATNGLKVTNTAEQAAKLNDFRYLEGTKRLADPAAAYDKYLAQSKKALIDIKADPAIAEVGEQIGNSFNKVVEQRRAVGKVMGEELKKVGGIKTNIAEDIASFDSELADSGLKYSSKAKGFVRDATSKMTDEDLAMINKYAAALKKLGTNPTIAEVDGFISRTIGEVNNLKSAKGIIETTNGERLIKMSQNALRSVFDPTKSGKELEAYAEARKGYAELSNVVNEGAQYLGKITQSGDFAGDAGLAKSAVQSIVGGGKKDFLVKLEELTKYPALDDAVLALQAMADAGDTRGLSLLQAISEGHTPASAQGITQKAIDYAMDLVKRAAVGTKEEQTRVFLKGLKEAAQKKL